MAVASGPAGLVLAGPVFTVCKTAHAQTINNQIRNYRQRTQSSSTAMCKFKISAFVIMSTARVDNTILEVCSRGGD